MFHTTAHMKNAVAATADRETALRLRTERRLIDLADSLIAANPAERADLVWRQRTSTDKVCTVPPGVDLALFNPGDAAQARRALGLGADEKVALFVGRIDPIKGIDTLLDAVKLLAHDGSDDTPTILFVGGDLDRSGHPVGALAEVAAAAGTLGIRELFRFEGSRPQPSLPTYYRAADVVVVPSRYESFGLVAVEAMACGTPVVVSRAGGLTFTVEDGVGGLVVPARDPAALASAVRRVLADDALRADLARGAQETAQRFSWPAVAAQISHVYARLATGHRADLCCDDEIFA
jgi:D-inositol-3-phosphate glycosyltransferase